MTGLSHISEKWDVHTHTTLSPATFDALSRYAHYAGFIRVRARAGGICGAEMVTGTGEVKRIIEENAYNAAARVKDADAHNVRVQVISPTPMMIPDYVDNAADAAAICRILNDDNAAMAARFPDRFRALGAVPLRFPDMAVREMERIHGEHGMRGIEILSNVNGADLDDAAFFPVFEAAEKMGMAVFIHPWGGFMFPTEEKLKKRMNPARNWRPWLLAMGMETALAFDSMRTGRVHERLPKLRVLYAHGGGAFPALLGRLEHGAYCRPDLFTQASSLNVYKTIQQCGVYADTLVHHPSVLGLLLDVLGAGRITVGSDYPYPLGEMDPFGTKGIYPGHMAEHLPDADMPMKDALTAFSWIDGLSAVPRINDEERARLLSGTAKEWLGVA